MDVTFLGYIDGELKKVPFEIFGDRHDEKAFRSFCRQYGIDYGDLISLKKLKDDMPTLESIERDTANRVDAPIKTISTIALNAVVSNLMVAGGADYSDRETIMVGTRNMISRYFIPGVQRMIEVSRTVEHDLDMVYKKKEEENSSEIDQGDLWGLQEAEGEGSV